MRLWLLRTCNMYNNSNDQNGLVRSSLAVWISLSPVSDTTRGQACGGKGAVNMVMAVSLCPSASPLGYSRPALPTAHDSVYMYSPHEVPPTGILCSGP